ncbi:MAG: tetratricopeptide repeat protein [Sciscionella sp.]
MSEHTRLKAAREARDWTQSKVARLIDQRAAALGMPSRSIASRQSELSRWENGRVTPDPETRRIFRELYGKTNAELGFPDEPLPDAAADELSERLAIARQVDAETIEMFRHQVNAVRHADRRFGSAVRLEQLRSQIGEIEQLLHHTLLPPQRAPLASVLTEASTLAGWDSLDSGTLHDAWRHYERAKAAARESGSTALLAHATAEQAFVLVDAGNVADALGLFSEARTIGEQAPRLLRAWLAAAEGEGRAIAGERTAALHAFDQAHAVLPNELVHPELPFLFLAGTHLDRWRGNALTCLGDREAIDHLEALLDRMPGSFVRARAATLVDLTLAHAAAGNRTAAETYAKQAHKIITQVGSIRLRRRLERLTLPGHSLTA